MGRDGFLLARQLVTDISERTQNKEIWNRTALIGSNPAK
jgi:hypothetical protein